MSMRRAKAPASDSQLGPSRRSFLRGAAGFLLGLGLPLRARRVRADQHASAPVTPELEKLLQESGFVYVSPLSKDGRESRCHGEVWFGWFDGTVVLITSKDSWKARSLAKGRDRARVWVGDHGRWKRLVGTNEEFRKAPSFEAKVEISKDADLLEKLMQLYTRKYPKEFGSWEQRMRSGFASGDRLLIRYRPVA